MNATSPRQTALVTGASLGIGLELAKNFAEDGIDLILVARSEGKLTQIAQEFEAKHGVKATVIAMDLAAPGAAEKLHAKVKALGLTVDYLVNNAGYGQYGRFLEIDAKVDLGMLQLNMIFLTESTRLFGQDMVERKQGRVLNVASTAAFQPGPLMATYYATKAYVLSLSEALNNEFKDCGVTVTALCPGPTRSGFQDNAKMAGSRILELGMMEAAPVAKQGYQAMRRGKAVIIPGVANNFLAQSVRFTPRSIVTKLSRYISERQKAAH